MITRDLTLNDLNKRVYLPNVKNFENVPYEGVITSFSNDTRTVNLTLTNYKASPRSSSYTDYAHVTDYGSISFKEGEDYLDPIAVFKRELIEIIESNKTSDEILADIQDYLTN